MSNSPSPTTRFVGKTALVTGATSGIGKAIAVSLAKEGANLVITGRRQQQGEEVKKRLEAEGAKVVFLQSDITDEANVEQMVKTAVDTFGQLDVAINNAGTEGQLGPVVDHTPESYQQVFDVNVMAVLISMKRQIKQMQTQGFGNIVNMASIAGLVGLPGGSVYYASKHAVLGLTKCAALEVAQENIRINAVSPGLIATDMADRFVGGDATAMAEFAAKHAMGRVGTVQEVADATLYLASDQASFVTGQSLVVDGGFTAQ